MRSTFALLPVACLLLSGCEGFFEDDPTDTDAALPPVDVDGPGYVPDDWPFEDAQRVVFFGDSITAGAGASSASATYTSLLLDDAGPFAAGSTLATRFPSMTEVVDASFGGATTLDLPRQFQVLSGQAGSGGTTLVIGTIGGNDAQQALFAGDAQAILDNALANLLAFVDDVNARFADARIVVANVYEPSGGLGQTDACFFRINYADKLPALAAFEGALELAAEERDFAVIDLRGHFLPYGRFQSGGDNGTWFANDCIHPNDQGHHEIRRLVLAALDGAPLDTSGVR